VEVGKSASSDSHRHPIIPPIELTETIDVAATGCANQLAIKVLQVSGAPIEEMGCNAAGDD
jgi:hypothetical protein